MASRCMTSSTVFSSLAGCQPHRTGSGASGSVAVKKSATRTAIARRRAICMADSTVTKPTSLGVGYPKDTQVLVIGGTGTLGRQIVRRLLDEGYDVRCLVRPRPLPADFLRDWGASTVQGDLLKPESLPAALVGIHTVIDASTARPEESVEKIDWKGKKALIQSAAAMGIQRYIFFSIQGCDKERNVPLMRIKYCTEKLLEEAGLNHTVFRLCGFMQGLIGQYAVPVLEDRQVWGTSDQTRIAYMDTQDIAKITLKALKTEDSCGKVFTLAGPKAFTSDEILQMCERMSNIKRPPKVSKVPVILLKVTRALTRSFQWSSDAADRLAFAEVLSGDAQISAPMEDTLKVFGMSETDITTVEGYLQEYFTKLLKKLKDLRAESKQTDFYL